MSLSHSLQVANFPSCVDISGYMIYGIVESKMRGMK